LIATVRPRRVSVALYTVADSAFANLREDFIWAEPGTGSQSHLRGVDYSDNVIDAQRKDNALLRFVPSTHQHRVELTVHD
jgi:hypothetical protein